MGKGQCFLLEALSLLQLPLLLILQLQPCEMALVFQPLPIPTTIARKLIPKLLMLTTMRLCSFFYLIIYNANLEFNTCRVCGPQIDPPRAAAPGTLLAS